MKIDIVNCFVTSENNSGNPAAVVTNFVGSGIEKQQLATKLNLPVTVFIIEQSNQPYLLEFYYPHTEMPLCLHGTLGAATILFDKEIRKLECVTKSGLLLQILKNENDIIQVQVSSQVVPAITIDQDEICKLIRLSDKQQIVSDLPFMLASVGSSKLLVPFLSMELLAELAPDFDRIKQWSIAHQVNGLYVYTADVPSAYFNFYARGFNPKGGHPEDAATGVAAAALAYALKRNITVGQGRFMNKPSQIVVSYESDQQIWVGGKTRVSGH